MNTALLSPRALEANAIALAARDAADLEKTVWTSMNCLEGKSAAAPPATELTRAPS